MRASGSVKSLFIDHSRARNPTFWGGPGRAICLAAGRDRCRAESQWTSGRHDETGAQLRRRPRSCRCMSPRVNKKALFWSPGRTVNLQGWKSLSFWCVRNVEACPGARFHRDAPGKRSHQNRGDRRAPRNVGGRDARPQVSIPFRTSISTAMFGHARDDR